MIENKLTNVIIALGSNLGARENYLENAQKEISKRAGTIKKRSSIIETKAYGYTEQDDFLNMAIEIETALEPHNLLEELLKIESELGRVRTIHWGPRTIDLDIIYYGDRIIDEDDLKIPHPELHKRDFVLKPIEEIDSEFFDPIRRKTVKKLLEELQEEQH